MNIGLILQIIGGLLAVFGALLGVVGLLISPKENLYTVYMNKDSRQEASISNSPNSHILQVGGNLNLAPPKPTITGEQTAIILRELSKTENSSVRISSHRNQSSLEYAKLIKNIFERAGWTIGNIILSANGNNFNGVGVRIKDRNHYLIQADVIFNALSAGEIPVRYWEDNRIEENYIEIGVGVLE